MADQTEARIFFYGLDPQADLWADHIEGLGLDGIRFRLHFQNEVIHLRVPMIGQHSVHTTLRAAAVGLLDGLTWEEIVNGLRSQPSSGLSPPGRQQRSHPDDTYNTFTRIILAAINLGRPAGQKDRRFWDMLSWDNTSSRARMVGCAPPRWLMN
jgi:UDP-N-acetylmuramoyl-tripeptide--D-alanyl-D-alanine ligase